LSVGSNAAAISAYMTELYGSNVVVLNGAVSTGGPLGSDLHLMDDGADAHWFAIQFMEKPITSVQFAWAGDSDHFHATADGVPIFDWNGDGSNWGTTGIITFAKPATTLMFTDSNIGAIRIDDLSVTTTPAPGAVLLGGLGVCLVGWLRRRNTL
jgi:hypothetical protein